LGSVSRRVLKAILITESKPRVGTAGTSQGMARNICP